MFAAPRLARWRAFEPPPRDLAKPPAPDFFKTAAELSLPDLLVAGRAIAEGDETSLLPEELETLMSRRTERLRASGAVRLAARGLLDELGFSARAIPSGKSGAPVFPSGAVGSFAHDQEFALAAVGRRRSFRAVGVDVEPAEPLAEELWSLVAAESERRRLGADPLMGRLLFSAKEAIYKAFFVLDGTRLDYRDIEVRLDLGRAQIRDGRLIGLRHRLGERVAVLAFLPERASG